jgi:hypothetical protein
VQTLHSSTGFPYFDFHRTVGKKYGGKPFGVKMQCNIWFSELIKAYNVLEKLELDICHHDNYEHADEILDTEYLQKIRPDIMAAKGGDISEAVTTTESPVFGGCLINKNISAVQLLDRKLVFTKRTKR